MVINKLNRTDLVQLLLNNPKGRFIGIYWVKADGTKGKISTNNILKMTNLGYLLICNSKGVLRTVDPRTIYKINANKQTYLHNKI